MVDNVNEDNKLNVLKMEIEEVKKKMNNNEDYKDNLKRYMRLRNKLRYWTDENYRVKALEKSANKSVMVKKYKEFLTTGQIQQVN
jgi:hypothetical protein